MFTGCQHFQERRKTLKFHPKRELCYLLLRTRPGLLSPHFFMQQESVCMVASSGLSLSVDSVKVSVTASGIELPWKRLCFLGFPEGCCGIEPLPGKLGFSCAGGCAPALPMWATLGVGQLAARQLAWAD